MQPIQKRAGMRKTIKRKPQNIKPVSWITKKNTFFPKKLTEYKFIIFTDLEPDDMVFLMLFTAWVKTNYTAFKKRDTYPIYSIVVRESSNKAVKIQRAKQFLTMFHLELGLSEESPDYDATLQRIWFDGDTTNDFTTEKQLLWDCIDNEGSEQLFENNIEELLKENPAHLFALYLKPFSFLKNIQLYDFLKKVSGIAYGSWNIKDIDISFFNRTSSDASLIYTDRLVTFGEKYVINYNNSQKFFTTLLKTNTNWTNMIKDVMYVWNDHILHKNFARLIGEPEFKDCDLTLKDIIQICDTLTQERRQELSKYIDVILLLLENHSEEIAFADQLVFLAMLVESGNLNSFTLERCKLNNECTINISKRSNTFALKCKSDDPFKLLEKLTLKAITELE